MTRSFPITAATLIGAAFLLSGYAGGGRVAASPATVPYVCQNGQAASAIYENGGDFLHAKVLLTYDGRTTELEAAPTQFGVRYTSAPAAGSAQHLSWSLQGEQAFLTEVADPADVTTPGRPIAQCLRQRGMQMASRSEGEH
ncbi:MliC family protein [Sphingosinicella sp. LHD-64]|uniref:MliC family protein n=1 Tax=Sphingosinicella sp. LHD-64 TaxID=3072139 RepID=UPI00280EA53B|nr:MliC family protein [Sphingosinicella sp. LHD-64]MDQ8757900.1 MliC family protein [Sphingosinicella sp. LHD-64]